MRIACPSRCVVPHFLIPRVRHVDYSTLASCGKLLVFQCFLTSNSISFHYFRFDMGKFYAEKSTPSKFGGLKSGIQKRSYNSGSGGGGGNRNFPKRKSQFMNQEEDLVAPNWDDYVLQPFKKEFYVPHENILKRSVFYYTYIPRIMLI